MKLKNRLSKTYSDFYQEISENFDQDFNSLIEFVNGCPAGEILEIGAGNGRLSKIDSDRHFTFLDKDFEMIEKFKVSNQNENHRIVFGDARKLPFKKNTFSGVIFAVNSIAEMSPLFFTLSEAYRVLRPNGKIYILVENPECETSYNPEPKLLKVGEESYTYTIDSYRKGKSDFSFITELSIRNSHEEFRFHIPQVFFNLKTWQSLLENCGFEATSVYGSYDKEPFVDKKSPLIRLECKKLSKPLPYDQPNLVQVYDSMAENYDNVVKKGNYRGVTWLTNQMKEFVNYSPKILDLGCGNGISGLALRSSGVDNISYGIDASESMIEICRSKNYHAAAVFDLSKGLPILEDIEFEVIAAMGLMEFIPNPEIFLKNCNQVLNKNGLLFISFEVGTDGRTTSLMPNSIKRYQYSENTLRELFESSGFIIDLLETNIAYVSPTSGDSVAYHFIKASKRD